MRRLALVAAVLALVLTDVSVAQSPSPTIHEFDTPVPAGTTYEGCGRDQISKGGWDDGGYLRFGCGQRQSSTDALITLRVPQALVQLFVRTAGEPIVESPFDGRLVVSGGPCVAPTRRGLSGGAAVDDYVAELKPPPLKWTPVAIGDPAGVPTIRCITVRTGLEILHIDDVGFSTTVAQPDTEITSAPADGDSTDATFAFSANQPKVGFACTLDGAAVTCPSPTLTGLPPGTHTFTVATRDRWGRLDATPASHTWTITNADAGGGELTTVSVPDRDRDGARDANDNCPDTPNTDQLDADQDAIGNACDPLPPGNVPPIAGVNAVMRLESGEVFVKLPATTPGNLRDLRAPFQDTGFVPLKGVASLPMGSVVDTRKGSVTAETAANGRPVGHPRRRLQSARFEAGIFRIRQARARQASSRRIPATAALVSAPGAQRACAGSSRRRPLKGVVRSLSIRAKGFYRAVGGASTGKATAAIWITTDRCDGTLTEVGRGRVKVRDRKRKRTVIVRAGRGYFAQAPLFLPLKGRPG